MDPEQFQQLSQAPFPAPPPFWQRFTVENVKRIQEVSNSSTIAFELNFLRPPSPPVPDTGSYMAFGVPQKLDPVPALPPPEILLFDPNLPSFSHATALRQLTKSLLLNFLELTTVLGNDPIKYEDKMQDIERLMLNVHFVINLYRPHQAREGVKEMLQTRLGEGQKEIERCDDMKHRIEGFLNNIGKPRSSETHNTRSVQDDDGKTDSDEKLWNVINSMQND